MSTMAYPIQGTDRSSTKEDRMKKQSFLGNFSPQSQKQQEQFAGAAFYSHRAVVVAA